MTDKKPARRSTTSPKPVDRAAWEAFKTKVKLEAEASTFKARLEQLETICRRTPDVLPNRPADEPPKRHSRAWFAEEILFSIESARLHMQREEFSYAAAEAIDIGVLAAQASDLKWPEVSQWQSLSDATSKDRALVHAVGRTAALAGQVFHEYSEKRFGLDAEIEFCDDRRRPTGVRIYMQLKSGDSHLRRRKRDGAEIFRIRHQDHSAYWLGQAHPVYLAIADSRGIIRWMDIRAYLAKYPQSRLVRFENHSFDVEALHECRRRLLAQHS